MGIFLVVLAFILLFIGILGAVVPVIPGPPLSYLGLLLLQWSGYAGFTSVFLWVWAGIALVITIMDNFLPSLLTKLFGGSKAAVIGSFVGLLAGIFLFPPIGMIAGPFFGALIGELIFSQSGGRKALKAAFGAFLAFIVGSGAKMIASAVMLYYAVTAIINSFH